MLRLHPDAVDSATPGISMGVNDKHAADGPVDPQATIDEKTQLDSSAPPADSPTPAQSRTESTRTGTAVTTDPTATPDPLETLDPLASYDPERTELQAQSQGQSDADAMGCATLDDQEQAKLRQWCSSFEIAWQSGDREPTLTEFIPAELEPGLRQLLARELVLIDIEHRRKRNKTLPPTVYLSQLADCRPAVESALSAHRSSKPRGYGSLTVPSGKGGRQTAPPPSHADDPSSRYRPTKIHARGGLGAVYTAHDTELNRVVALKEILPEHSGNSRYQDKFVFEAEVTGSLEHPGIVPVYGLGRYQDSMPYYAMRFIRGRSFRASIQEFHQRHPAPSAGTYLSRDFRKLLQHLIETCYAIHYAHEHGVLHRDIKPDNIMLGDYGETLVVDWGLAKRMENKPDAVEGRLPKQISISGSGKNTSMGSAVGTPMYMSPEQAYGYHDQLDGRTDVYSLGAVLFNILTAGHPFEGDSAAKVLLNVRAGKKRDVESLAPSAPRALASICRKAMHTRPEDRYDTAIELADDIDRWLSDEAVLAHSDRETFLERAGRLLRRYRSWTVSAAAAQLIITLVAILAVLLINHAKDKERLAKLEASGFKQDAVARYRESRDAIDTWLVQSSDVMEFFPGAQSVRRRLLQLATEDYEKLAARPSRDAELELERARARVKLGDLSQMQEDHDAAVAHYTAALQWLEVDVADERLSLLYRAEHGNTRNRLAGALASLDEPVAADAEMQAAIDELTRLAADSGEAMPQQLLAVARVNAGELAWNASKSDAAIEHLQEALKRYEALTAEPASGQVASRRVLGMARARELLGRVYTGLGQHEQALIYFNETIEDLDSIVAAEPDQPEYLDALASAHISSAKSFQIRGLDQQWLDSLTAAAPHYAALRAAVPDLPRYAEHLAITITDIGLALHASAANEEAKAKLIEAHSILTALIDSYGSIPPFQSDLCACEDALGQVLLDGSSNPQDALSILSQAVEGYDQLVQSSADPPLEWLERRAIATSHCAQAAARAGNGDLARQLFETAIAELGALIEKHTELPALRSALAHVHDRYARMLHGQQAGLAKTQFETAIRVWSEIEPAAASHAHDLAWLLATCPDDSLVDPAASLQHARQAVELAPENARYLSTLALSTLRSGNADEAVELLDRARSLRGDWIDRDYYVLAMAQYEAGDPDQAQQSLAAGTQWQQRHQPYNTDVLRLREMAATRLESRVN
jgi:serine/threonine-protein kinase